MSEHNKEALLQRYFGYDEFRSGQLELIDQLLDGGDCLGVMPTGAGKSLCYQLPALALEGLTLVISPLISLMHDQVGALVDAGIKAAYLNSSQTAAQRADVLRAAKLGYFQLLYIAPERLEADDFIDFAQNVSISLIAVDEAHCISHWGQDFRPSYLRIPVFIDSLTPRPPVGAFTATATKHVKSDIIELLKLRDPLTIATGFDRPNLYFAISKPKDKAEALLAFLCEANEAGSVLPTSVPAFIAGPTANAIDPATSAGTEVDRETSPVNPSANPLRSGIVYCSTRKNVEEVCQELIDAGFAATRYHAGLTEIERKTNQDDFLYDRKAIMVATNAFGMGIDKSNVNFVVHYNMPKNLESYYQEAGRAGRDGTPATCLLLYAPKDVQTNKFLITHGDDVGHLDAESREELQQKDLELLKQMTFYATTNECLRAFILDYFGEPTAPFCGNCSNCLTTFAEVDATIDAQKIISCVYRLGQQGRSFGRSMIVDILRGSKSKRILQMGLDSLSTYSIMADAPAQRVYNVLDSLAQDGYLLIGGGEYPVVQLANNFRELLGADAQYIIKLPKEIQREKKVAPAKKDRSSAVAAVLGSPAEFELFEALRALRFDLATQADLPAYIVFSDATLRDMVIRRPNTEAEFLEVSGVGAKKLETYGKAFLACIASYRHMFP
ncbi:ATP-dependent DNA helicase RecQ [Actinomycetota bacterium]|nr:ATP-dependent DNA helicase RecQ [Actinomycetota bacterium]